ncbi:MAG: hypothetical protein B1H12_02620 [Desulfobacteraceae bacterium 4484_190.2]|nr:MAG: hypothetical protein B1H12_02620 [Desulfobacteraceae bacterium 4484_190.2]
MNSLSCGYIQDETFCIKNAKQFDLPVFIRHSQACQLMNFFGRELGHNSVKTCLTFESIFR